MKGRGNPTANCETDHLGRAEPLVYQAIQDAQGETAAFIEDSRISKTTQIVLRDMRDWFLTLDQDGYVDLALAEGGLKARVTPEGRLALGLYRLFPTHPAPLLDPARPRSRTGRERALVFGVSDYPPPIPKLPAVANDVREIGKLLGSDQGQFPAQNVRCLADWRATRQAVLEAINSTFSAVEPEDAVFVYKAGHGAVVGLTGEGRPVDDVVRGQDISIGRLRGPDRRFGETIELVLELLRRPPGGSAVMGNHDLDLILA